VKPKPDEEDIALFREATRGVKPLAASPRAEQGTPLRRPRARLTRVPRLRLFDDGPPGAEPEAAPGEATTFVRAGIAHSTLRRLRRGQYRIEAELDLHGLTVSEAQRRLCDFLLACLQRNVRCAHIVHGKGLRSGANGPVLRRMVNHTLARTSRVRAFVSARQSDGGTGALYVLLAVAHASSASTTAE